MLKSLHIENYALIAETDISFCDGFTVITGETGAGKSILLGALGLLLGQRADTQVLADPTRRCVVEASFDIAELGLRPLFERFDADYDDLLLHGIQKDRRYISPIYTVKPWKSPYPPHRTWQLRVPLVVGYEPTQLVLCTLRNDKLSALPTRIVERRIEGKPGRWLEADVRVYGNFVVASDTAAPYVKPLNFKQGGKVAVSSLRMKMGDNLSGVKEYRCFINGEWVLGEFDGKTATLSIALDQVPSGTKNLELNIFLKDCCDNASEVVYHLKR